MNDLRWCTSPGQVDEDLRRALTTCWRDVANGGGAVGFAEHLPVGDDVVRPAVDDVADGLGTPGGRLLLATADGALAGWLLLTTNASPVVAHWGRVTRLQTSPAARGTGVARAMLTELHRVARDELGLESLRLEVRGGAGLEGFYERFGYAVVGCWPGALQITAEDRRDEVLMNVHLTRRGAP